MQDWENSKKLWKHSPVARVPTAYLNSWQSERTKDSKQSSGIFLLSHMVLKEDP